MILQLLFSGIVVGAIYALMAVSFWIILRPTGIFHLAHAGTAAITAYAILVLHNYLSLPLLLAIVLALGVSAASGLLFEMALYRPLRRRMRGRNLWAGPESEVLSLFIASLFALSLVQAVLTLVFRPQPRHLVAGGYEFQRYEVAGVFFTGWHLLALSVTAATFLCAWWFYERTQMGQSSQALASNPTMARAIGIDADQVTRAVFVVGSVLTVPVVVLLSLSATVRPTMGLHTLLVALVAVVIGGSTKVYGAAVGGLFIGVAEHLALLVLPSYWQGAIAFGLLFVVLLARPTGMLRAVRLRH